MNRIVVTVLIIVIAIALAHYAARAHGQPAPAEAAPAATQPPETQPAASNPSAWDALAGLMPAKSQDLVEKIQGGEVNWTTGELIAIGEGKAQGVSGQQIEMAKRAARLVAARNALLTLSGVRVGGGGRFNDVREATIKVEGVLENFREVGSDFDPKTHTATVKLAVPIFGAHGMVKMFGVELRRTIKAPALPKGTKPADVKLIVIDARGTGLRPSVVPRLAKASGDVFYDLADTSAFKAAKQPVVFVHMLPDAKLDKGLAETDKGQVVVLTAQKPSAKSPSTVTLSDDDAADLMSYLATGGLLDSGQLVVITDPPEKTPTTKPKE